jgi:hypothetical protein
MEHSFYGTFQDKKTELPQNKKVLTDKSLQTDRLRGFLGTVMGL